MPSPATTVHTDRYRAAMTMPMPNLPLRMKLPRSLYARPEIVRGQECANGKVVSCLKKAYQQVEGAPVDRPPAAQRSIKE
jgi:hypothetical protein